MPFLLQTGFKESDVTWVPISGLNGDNIKDKVDPKVCSWYQGPSLVELVDKLPLEKRDPDGPLRIPVLDKWTEQGTRTIFGKIE
jgi:peptide chain release factor subunit 3